MKILTTSLVFLILSISSKAQITVDDGDMPSAGDIHVSSIADPTSIANPETTGTNHLWDFSSLTAVAQRVDTFLSISSTPLAYQFFFNNVILYPDHQADFGLSVNIPNVIPQVSVTDVINYYAVNSGSYEQVGFGANINGIPTSTRYLPTDTQLVFPANYGVNYSSQYYYEMSIPGLAFLGQDGSRQDTIDGWGSLITPYGQFDVLRVKSTLEITDTTYIDLLSTGTSINRPTTIEYKWWAKNEGIPLLTVVSTGGFVTSIEYKDTLLNLGLEYEEAIPLSIYPNPSQDYIKVSSQDFADADFYTIHDLNGRLLRKDHVLNNSQRISVSDLKNGMYILSILKNRRLMRSTRFEVMR